MKEIYIPKKVETLNDKYAQEKDLQETTFQNKKSLINYVLKPLPNTF